MALLRGVGIAGRTVTLKVKFADFRQVTRSRSLPGPVAARTQLESVTLDLLRSLLPVPKGVRLLGVTLSSLGEEVPATPQLQLPV